MVGIQQLQAQIVIFKFSRKKMDILKKIYQKLKNKDCGVTIITVLFMYLIMLVVQLCMLILSFILSTRQSEEPYVFKAIEKTNTILAIINICISMLLFGLISTLCQFIVQNKELKNDLIEAIPKAKSKDIKMFYQSILFIMNNIVVENNNDVDSV
jgi:uncharacterized BrkB/YihY/UPF0761 family membrane protein